MHAAHSTVDCLPNPHPACIEVLPTMTFMMSISPPQSHHRRRRRRLSRRERPHPAYRLPDAIAVLSARNEFLSGQATWIRREGIWSCRSADPCLRWMVGMSRTEAKFELVRRGFSYEWH